jgi:adenylate cyclase
MGEDEQGTLSVLTGHRTEMIEPCIESHHGRVVKTTGDGLLAEFSSVVDALQCAVSFQEGMVERNTHTPKDRRIEFRIGVNLGDIIFQDGDVYGDGVNIAARLEGLAEPGGICISEIVHQAVDAKVEYRFDDLGPQRVKNIGKPVRTFSLQITPESEASQQDSDIPPSLPAKPSIAVLPFDNMSGDPEQEYFSDGITEDIITELSKISGLFVIARHSAFIYKGKSVTLKQVGRELGVRCVLEGSVRKAGNRLRITAQLIDTMTDHHLWAERYDRDIEDIFAVQDEVARHVADALAVALKPGENEKLAHAPTENVDAYDLYLRTRMRPWPPTRTNIVSTIGAYASVIEVDPTFAGGYAGKSIAHSMAAFFGHSDDRDADVSTSIELAQKAVELDAGFALSHSALGISYAAAGEYEKAIASAQRGVELQPGDADSHAWLARCFMLAGKGDEACDEAETAFRLDPQYIEGPYLNLLGRVLFLAGRYQESIETYKRNDARGGPRGGERHILWAAASGHLGRDDEAKQQMQEIFRFFPDFSFDKFIKRDRTRSELEARLIIEGLRKAGIVE